MKAQTKQSISLTVGIVFIIVYLALFVVTFVEDKPPITIKKLCTYQYTGILANRQFYQDPQYGLCLLDLTKFQDTNCLIKYSFNLQRPVEKIMLKFLESTDYPRYFYYSKDKIFILYNHYTSKPFSVHSIISQLLNNGKYYTYFDVNAFVNAPHYSDVWAGNYAPIYINGDVMDVVAFQRTKEFKSPVDLKFDLRGLPPYKFLAHFPDVYKQGKFYGFISQKNVSRVINKNKEYIFSFPIDHNLYKYDSTGTLIATIPAKSRYIDTFTPFQADKINDAQTDLLSQQNAACYRGLLYDEVNNIYYRVAYHNIKPAEDGKRRVRTDGTWSIMALDSNLKIMGEKLFTFKQYASVFTCAGLLILANNGNCITTFDLYQVTCKQ